MAQEILNVDYESMVDKYMNEWEECNLREFRFNEKVNDNLSPAEIKEMAESKMAEGRWLKIF